ncbi:MAG: AAA family ATPase [Cytophagales bacterium]
MSEIFIKEIKVNKVRHLHDLYIPISDNEKKHLIITGKNGSGKTSLLLEIKKHLEGIPNEELLNIENLKNEIWNSESSLKNAKNKLESENDGLKRIGLKGYIKITEDFIKNDKIQIEKFSSIELIFKNLEFVYEHYKKGEFVFAFFNSKRTTQLTLPKGIQKLEIKKVYNIEEKANQSFIQYLVNLKAQRSFARDANNMKTVEEIDLWFQSFEGYLKELFGDPSLYLEFDSDNFDFNIVQEGKEKYNFNTLSDGYSAILNIITELIMRMEKKSPRFYDTQGIVLIDEVETHLHIDLQKQILPFLTKVFPKIQFIVTTHSPFVLNSISNATVYDLELQEPVHDMSGYSVEGIIESYFDADKYSDVLKGQVAEYETLWLKENLSDDELLKLKELRNYFTHLPKINSEEFELKIKQIELSKIRKI